MVEKMFARQFREAKKGCLILVGVIALLVIWGAISSGSEKPTAQNSARLVPAVVLPTVTPTPMPVPTRWQDADDSIMASVMVENFVRDRLKAPSTAKFPSIWEYRDEQHITHTGQTYTVRSWVDTENSFGAMIRTRYVAVMEQTEPGRWLLLSLIMDE